MASAKFNKGSEEWMMFMDFYALSQKHWIPEDEHSFWDIVISDTNDFVEKYKSIPLAEELGLSFLKSLEKQIKARRLLLNK